MKLEDVQFEQGRMPTVDPVPGKKTVNFTCSVEVEPGQPANCNMPGSRLSV
jgi:hypothetical protein